jgi:hypothetical protein
MDCRTFLDPFLLSWICREESLHIIKEGNFAINFLDVIVEKVNRREILSDHRDGIGENNPHRALRDHDCL